MKDTDIRKKKIRLGEIHDVLKVLRENRLNTVCEEARCPNISECMSKRRVTFMIMGDGCTRGCRFCSVRHYAPEKITVDEAERIKRSVISLGIRYVVITSVTRDDLPLGGAPVFRDVVKALNDTSPDLKIELLIPDFSGDEEAWGIIASLRLDVLGHNIETVRRLYPLVRPEADYDRSLELLRYFSKRGFFTKSGIIVGLGESREELYHTFSDLRDAGVNMLTIGQYMRPSINNIDVVRYYSDSEFESLRDIAHSRGIPYVFSGAYVRSSYSAEEQYEGARR